MNIVKKFAEHINFNDSDSDDIEINKMYKFIVTNGLRNDNNEKEYNECKYKIHNVVC